MQTRVKVLRIPGTPLTINDLRPSAFAAQIAGELDAAECSVTVADFGTSDFLQQLYPRELQTHASQAAESWKKKAGSDYRKLIPSQLSDRHGEVWEQVGERVAARRDFDCLFFQIDASKDIEPAVCAARRVRALIPSTTIFVGGRELIRRPKLASKMLRDFDCVYTGHAGSAIGRLVRNFNDRRHWPTIADLAYMDGVRFSLTPPAPQNEPASPAAYGPEIYGDRGPDSQFMLFDIPENRPQTGLVDTLKQVISAYGTRAFHFDGQSSGAEASGMLGHAILANSISMVYSRMAEISAMNPSATGSLRASGCRAVGFRIDSGSQRLLDTYYRNNFCVTQVERLVRACKFSNLFTTTTYTYPSPEDDHHTRAETMRLIARTLPDSVTLEAPDASLSNEQGMLFHEFRPFARRNRRRTLAERASLQAEVETLGIDTGLTPEAALLAQLAGEKDSEAGFIARLNHLVAAGDAKVVTDTIRRFNESAASPPSSVVFKPFTSATDAVAN